MSLALSFEDLLAMEQTEKASALLAGCKECLDGIKEALSAIPDPSQPIPEPVKPKKKAKKFSDPEPVLLPPDINSYSSYSAVGRMQQHNADLISHYKKLYAKYKQLLAEYNALIEEHEA